MPAWLRLIPGTTIRWQGRRFVIVDYAGFEAIVAREIGKRRLHRVPLDEVLVDLAPGDRNAWTPDLTATREKAWQTAVRRFKILKPLIELDQPKRTFAEVKKIAHALRKHPSTIYRWIEDYKRTERLSVFLRKERSDRGKSRLSNKLNAIIEAAINKIYLKAEQPDVAAVIEEVQLQCFKAKIRTPHPVTVRRRVAALPDRLKLEKRESRKAAAEKYEPIKGHFPGADHPLAVVQIDHTPMDVIVVDEEHRQPDDRGEDFIERAAVEIEKLKFPGHRMSSESRNTRMISFRLDAEEYETFRQLCHEQGTGNISEMARAGLRLILGQPSIARTESLDRRVTYLESRLRAIYLEVRKLRTNSASDSLAESPSESL